jgi:hypothetical protein
VGGACGFLYARILHRIGHLPGLSAVINAVHMRWAGYSPAPVYFINKMPSDCTSWAKKRPRFAEPLRTNTDTPLMHNVGDRIGAALPLPILKRAPDKTEIRGHPTWTF